MTTEATEHAATWVKDAWYVACRSSELEQKPIGREICGQKLVFYRSRSGVTALEDFCPHRGAPLSLGFLREGELVCGYHGLEMGCDGKTRAMPNQRVNAFPPIRAFPAEERYGFVWVWPGDATLADAGKLPHLPWAESEHWAYGGGLFHIDCDYRLMIDNLMDLTHETYVHADTIGQPEIDEAPVETLLEGDEVVTRRFMHDIPAPAFWRMALRGAGLPEASPVDRWQICRFSLPSHVMIEVGVALAGRGGYHAQPQDKVSSIVVDFITPETETSHWYFWGMARNFKVDDDALTESIREGQAKIFSEDLDMLQRQQLNLTRQPGRRLLKLNIDAGGVRSRMQIERSIASRQATPRA